MSKSWDYSVFWEEAKKILASTLSEQEFVMWISRLEYRRSEEGQLYISVPSQFFRDQIKTRYLQQIESTLLDLSGLHLQVDFEISSPGNLETESHRSEDKSITARQDVQSTLGKTPQTSASTQGPGVLASKVSTNTKVERHPQLNPDYIFDNFVVGDNNKFGAHAAMAIGKNPGTTYNPFLIYGSVGLGKTHLIQSIGNYIHAQGLGKKIIYVQMESFTNEFIQSIQERKTANFKAKYRNVDVLLIDDIHFIQGKNETQEELFYTFNALYENKKQMVFTCDRPVSEIKELTERLKSRFERGLNVDLQPPNYETRLAIIKKKCESMKLSIPDESLHLICVNITTNVRDLEKALTKMKAYSELMGIEASPEITRQQLKDFFFTSTKKNISIDLIIREVASYFNLSHQELKGKRRNQSVSLPRQVAMFIARELTEFSTTEIGIEFGGRDHTTIMHGCQKIADMMKTDPTIEPIIRELMRKIKMEGNNS